MLKFSIFSLFRKSALTKGIYAIKTCFITHSISLYSNYFVYLWPIKINYNFVIIQPYFWKQYDIFMDQNQNQKTFINFESTHKYTHNIDFLNANFVKYIDIIYICVSLYIINHSIKHKIMTRKLLIRIRVILFFNCFISPDRSVRESVTAIFCVILIRIL